jgi:hypothetical protein
MTDKEFKAVLFVQAFVKRAQWKFLHANIIAITAGI